jgi:peptidoglycan/xylan/chitin deacetylase (PgdA/CDA1 family)
MADILALSYHAVSERWPSPLAVRPDALERQLGALVRAGYRGATFTEAVTAPPGDRVVAVTFDDAFRSVLTAARPVLDALGLPATVFAPTAWVGGAAIAWPGLEHWRGTPEAHELRPMTWDELAELAAGGWEIGSHTCTHPYLTKLEPGRALRELRDSRAACEDQLGRACTSLAYPYGDHDDVVVALAATAGYRAAATVPVRLCRPEPLRWPRIGIYRDDGERSFALKVSPAVRRLRRGPAWSAVAAARRGARRGAEAELR